MTESRPTMLHRGLTRLTRERIEHVLRALHRGTLQCPITPEAIARHGWSDFSDELSLLRGLDHQGVHAVLVAVLAERDSAKRSKASGEQPV